MKVDVKGILLKRIDLKGLLLEDVLKGVLEPAIQALVAKSENKVDDAIVAMLLPVLEAALVEFVEENLKKLND